MHNFPKGVLDPILKDCPKTHTHQIVEGWCKGHGRRSVLTKTYPYRFCKALATILHVFLGAVPMDNDSLLVNDILAATFSLPEQGSLHRHLQAHNCADHGLTCVTNSNDVSGAGYLAETLRPIPVKDHLTHCLMQTINSLPAGAEWPMHACRGGHLDDKLAHLALQARKRFLPQHSFRKCTALRGTLGEQSPVGSVGEGSYLLLWKNLRNHDGFILSVCRTLTVF
jgi:hypothetical protein